VLTDACSHIGLAMLVCGLLHDGFRVAVTVRPWSCRRVGVEKLGGRAMRRSIGARFQTLVAAAAVSVTVLGGLVAFAVPASAASNPTPAAGARRSATRLPFSVSGTTSFSVDVATGNVLFTDQLITLPGAVSSVPIQLWFNSTVLGTSTPSAVTGSTGTGWGITGFNQRLVVNSDTSVTYYRVDGLSGVFIPSGSAYVPPAQYQADLVKTGTTGWTLTDHGSQTKLTFNSGGRLIAAPTATATATAT
jgi:hypothetical protein